VGVRRRDVSGKCQFLDKSKLVFTERREIALDHRVIDQGEGRGIPARLLVLVDEHGAHPLVKIVAGHDVLGQPVFEGERLLDRKLAAGDQLAQGDLEAGRRFRHQAGARFRGPLGIRPALRRLTFERIEDRLDRVAGKAAVDRRLAGADPWADFWARRQPLPEVA